MRLVVLENLGALFERALIAVGEIAKIVADQEQDAIVLGDIGAARTLGGTPAFLLLSGEKRIDILAHRKSELHHEFNCRTFLLLGAIGDVKDLSALRGSILRELDRPQDGNIDLALDVFRPSLGREARA